MNENQLAERLLAAAEALERASAAFAEQQQTFAATIDRIVATADDSQLVTRLNEQIAELKQKNAELSAGASRKTLPSLVTAILGKNNVEAGRMDVAALDKALTPLTIDQRIAVKAEMARAGLIE